MSMTHSINDIVRNIRNFRIKNGIAKSRLAIMAGISEGIMRNMDDEKWNPTLKAIRKIEEAIKKYPKINKS